MQALPAEALHKLLPAACCHVLHVALMRCTVCDPSTGAAEAHCPTAPKARTCPILSDRSPRLALCRHGRFRPLLRLGLPAGQRHVPLLAAARSRAVRNLPPPPAASWNVNGGGLCAFGGTWETGGTFRVDGSRKRQMSQYGLLRGDLLSGAEKSGEGSSTANQHKCTEKWEKWEVRGQVHAPACDCRTYRTRRAAC